MSFESATEPQDREQLCAMQEGLLQRCLRVLEDMDAESIPAGIPESRYQELLDDLRAHVDPDAPPPADARLLAMANTELLRQLQAIEIRLREVQG